MTTDNLWQPWVTELDERLWIDESTGLTCLILRQNMGHLCGYVQSALTEDDGPFDVHGGITFSGKIEGRRGHWIGFDCAHSGDLIPELHRNFEATQSVYKNMNYVKLEVKNLAMQVKQYVNQRANK